MRLGAVGEVFEIEARDRLLPMEGLRGIAVTLVFLQHYCRQFAEAGNLTGFTAWFVHAFTVFGNYGVELFFVLSGFLIYNILLRKRPPFLQFMLRRAQRLYPAFLAALFVAILADAFRPEPYIPHDLILGPAYLFANLAFLPGLFPITPLSAVNWSLSYEWWFYVSATALFVSAGLSQIPASSRIMMVALIGAILFALSHTGFPHIPISGLSLLAGVLLAEAHRAGKPGAPWWLAVGAMALAFVMTVWGHLSPGQMELLQATCFYALCSCALFRNDWVSAIFSLTWLRRLGNMSYSFYLIHGFAVLALVKILLGRATFASVEAIFWFSIGPVFIAAALCGATLFLLIEKPLSLQVKVSPRVSEPAASESVSP